MPMSWRRHLRPLLSLTRAFFLLLFTPQYPLSGTAIKVLHVSTVRYLVQLFAGYGVRSTEYGYNDPSLQISSMTLIWHLFY